jgi:hypothetical protein
MAKDPNRAQRMKAASKRQLKSATGPDSAHYEPGSTPSNTIRVGRMRSFEEAAAMGDAERARQNAMGREQRRAESPKPVPGWDATFTSGPEGDVAGSIPNETTRRGPGSPSSNPDQTKNAFDRRHVLDSLIEASRAQRTRVTPHAAGTPEGPSGGGLPASYGAVEAGKSAVVSGPRSTQAARAAEERIGAVNPNVTPGSLSEISPEERKQVNRNAANRRVSGTRRRSGGGSTPDLNTVAVGDTSGERVRTSAARARARTAPGKSAINPAAVDVSRQLNTAAKKKAAADFERSATRKAEARAGAAEHLESQGLSEDEAQSRAAALVTPAKLDQPKQLAPHEVIGTKEYHLARVSEATGHKPEHLESFIRAQGLSVEQGAKGMYDLVHRETKGAEMVQKGSGDNVRMERQKKAVTVVSRNGKTFYEKGTGNGTPALEALSQKVNEHIEGQKSTRRKSGSDVATEAIMKAVNYQPHIGGNVLSPQKPQD